jgi:hypothetical protein
MVDKVEWATTPSAGGPPAEANVTFKDIGKTPAVEVRKFIALRRFRPLSKSDPEGTEKLVAFLESAFSNLGKQSQAPEKYAAKIRSDIAPNVPQFSTATDTDRPPLTNQDIKDLAQSALAFFFVGIFQYTDGFKGTYETQSCYIFWGTDLRLWHLCDAHNIIE